MRFPRNLYPSGSERMIYRSPSPTDSFILCFCTGFFIFYFAISRLAREKNPIGPIYHFITVRRKLREKNITLSVPPARLTRGPRPPPSRPCLTRKNEFTSLYSRGENPRKFAGIADIFRTRRFVSVFYRFVLNFVLYWTLFEHVFRPPQ